MSCTKSASSSSDEDAELRRGPWTVEEDALLIQYIASHGEGRWNVLAKLSGLKRTGKSCRLRWLNYLKPDVKRGNLTPEEQLLILELHAKWGNRWSKIAQHLPGRTDNEIKNYWRTRVQKQAKHLKLDSNSSVFQQLVRSLWVPHLQVHEPSLTASSFNATNNFQNPAVASASQELIPEVLSNISNTTHSLCYHHDTNLGSQNVSELPINMSYVNPQPQVPDYSANPLFALDNYGCCLNDTASLNFASMSIAAEEIYHTGTSNWVQMGEDLWNNMDDQLWQHRQFHHD